MKRDLSRCVPPGVDAGQEKGFFVAGLVCAGIYNLFFVLSYVSAIRQLWRDIEYGGVRSPSMPVFDELFRGKSYGFWVLAVCMLLLTVYHYASHRMGGSRSIYLMRRLPNRWELHRRCWTVPVAGAVISAAAAVVMVFLCYGIYALFTPDMYMHPESIGNLLRYLF